MARDPYQSRFMPDRRSVSRAQLQIGGAFAVLGLLIFGAVGLFAGDRARSHVTEQLSANLAQVATRLSMGLDIGLYERHREIQNIASLEPLVHADLARASWRPVVDRLQASFPQYAWIGVASSDDGTVIASTGGVLEGASVARRPWFAAGLRGPYVGDVHDAVMLASLLPASPSREPLRLLDVAAPIRRDGRVVAVLGAHVDWAWVEERRQRVLATLEPMREVDLRLVDARGVGLHVGRETPTLAPEHVAELLAGGPQVLGWSDGRRYLSAAVRSGGYRGYPGLGWTVLARQPLEAALAPARRLQWQILAIGLAGAALFGLAGWWLAGRLTEPLRRVARQALGLVASEPAHGSLGEVDQLSLALGRLVDDLRSREAELSGLNESLERRVKERTAALEVANEDLKSFSRSVSHDLKGPIASMGAIVREVLAVGHGLDAGAQRMLAVVAGECDRLSTLVDELLALASVEQRPLQLGAVEMGTLAQLAVADVLALPSPVAGAATAPPDVHVAALPATRGDAVLLRQVWQNLVANAVKFSARVAAPRIEISGEVAGEECIYCVRDNGAGFDPQHAHRLFGAFQRLHRAADFPGTGIGLSIVKRVVHRHGGRVWAQSAPGQGAQFWFALPKGSGGVPGDEPRDAR